MNVLKTTLIAAALVAAGVAGNANAGTDSTTFNVKIVITEACTISTVAATDVDFQSHPRSTGEPVLAQGTLNVNCSLNTPYQIGLNGGLSYNGSGTQAAPAAGGRRMAHPTLVLWVPYDLYQDAGRSDFWGNTAGVDTYSGVGAGASQAIPVYGRVPSTNFPAGAYSDTVTATLTY